MAFLAAQLGRPIVMRIVVSVAAICLGTATVMAASPKIEAAVKTFKAVAADPARLKLFCAMNAALDDAAEKKDKAAAAKIPAAHEADRAGFRERVECGRGRG